MNVIQELVKRNNKKYNIKKCGEEASELGTAIFQLLNKWHSPEKRAELLQAVIDEIGDLEIRLPILKAQIGKALVDKRVRYKLKKYREYIKANKYKDI